MDAAQALYSIGLVGALGLILTQVSDETMLSQACSLAATHVQHFACRMERHCRSMLRITLHRCGSLGPFLQL